MMIIDIKVSVLIKKIMSSMEGPKAIIGRDLSMQR